MDELQRSMDYDDSLLAEIYDQQETSTEDVELIRILLPPQMPLNILECFSGTGRILVPLARDGHQLTGIEISEAMAARARNKLANLGEEVRSRVRLVVGDVLVDDWGKGYDVVLLGCDCFFELPSPESQEDCVRRASQSLVPGGYLFVDTNDGSGHGADPSEIGSEWTGLEGTTPDGVYGKLSAKVLDVNEKGVPHFIRTWYKKRPDGTEETRQYAACKYPVSGEEVETWLGKHGFQVLKKYGGYSQSPYIKGESGRAIFWARKQ